MMANQPGLGGRSYFSHLRLGEGVLLTLFIQPLAMLTERPTVSALREVITFDVVTLGAFVVVVVHVRRVRLRRVPRAFVTHN